MSKRFITVILSICCLTGLIAANKLPVYKDKNKPIETRVNDLLGRMTLEEKIGQLNMPALLKVDDKLKLQLKNAEIGAFCGVRFYQLTAAQRDSLQQLAYENSRLGIPVIFAFDVIHGYRTIFPIPLALSATWNPLLVKQTAQLAALEASVDGINMTFSPMVDVSRDARWGRISESSGEDVLLNQSFAKAMVEGYQGSDLNAPGAIGSCVKHFVGYGAAIGGRDYQFTELSERALRETYLPPFDWAVNSGAVSLMSAFNDISGTPATANYFSLTKVLRGEWNFKGFVVSDWKSVEELKDHGIVGTDLEAAKAALHAGTDMEMESNCYKQLKNKSYLTKIDLEKIDLAVQRVLRVKFQLGLFEQPFIQTTAILNKIKSTENRTLARKAASESMVLLKNDNILPLTNSTKRITLLGEWANSSDVLGWWTGNGNRSDVITVAKGLADNAPKGVQIFAGAEPQSQNDSTIIVCVGESGNMFGENNCRTDLELPWGQTEQIKQLKGSGKKVIVVVFNGRPLVLTEIIKYADAVILAWHPGTETGNALADILFGKENPSGHLTVSLPKKTGQVPLFYSERNSGRPANNRYVETDAEPLFPFGYGLSYTKFEYSNMRVSKNQFSETDTLELSITVKNNGNWSGKDVIQVYMHDKVAKFTQPKKKLIDFRKIELKKLETKEVQFKIPAKAFAILDSNYQPVIEPGDFDIWIGSDSNDEKNHCVVSFK